MMSFGERESESPPEARDRLIHAQLSDGRFVLMASDTMPDMPYSLGDHVYLSLVCESAEQLDERNAALSSGGETVMAAQAAFWGAYFARLVDRFRMGWMLSYERPAQGGTTAAVGEPHRR